MEVEQVSKTATRYQLRRFRRADAQAVHALLHQNFLERDAEECEPKGRKHIEDQYDLETVRGWTTDYVIVAWLDSTILGFGRILTSDWITHLCVAGGDLRLDVSQSILAMLERHAVSKHTRYIHARSLPSMYDFWKDYGYYAEHGPILLDGIPIQTFRKELRR